MRTERHKLLSVIIPVYNTADYLGAALDSVFRQDYEPMEVVVLDDGSWDRSGQIARSYGPPVRYRRQHHQGVAAARNAGMAIARGEYLAFLDADDLYLPGKLKAQTEALRQDKKIDMVFGSIVQFVSPELDAEVKAHLRCPPEPQPGYCATCLMVRRHSATKVGPFAPGLRAGEFIDWFDRARHLGLAWVHLPFVVAKRRLHPNNSGRRNRAAIRDYAVMAKAAIDRRRNKS